MRYRKTIILCIACIVILLLTTCSCSSQSIAENHRMVILEEIDELHGCICYDKKTKVEYFVSNGQENRGVLTVLVDADGKPLLYDGEY